MNQVFAVYYDNGAMYPEDYQNELVKLFSTRELAEQFAQLKKSQLTEDDYMVGVPSYIVSTIDVLDGIESL